MYVNLYSSPSPKVRTLLLELNVLVEHTKAVFSWGTDCNNM